MLKNIRLEKNDKPIKYTCTECRDGKVVDFPFTMAFQPIYDAVSKNTYAQEALVRGPNQEGAGSILGKVTRENIYQFDQSCRVKAIALASQLNMPCRLSINFMPNAVYNPQACLRTTLDACEEFGFPKQRIIFEVTEGEDILDHNHLSNILNTYKSEGFQTAIDDFGAGSSGLNLLAEFQPDLIKLDMALIRNIHKNPVKQSITRAVVQVCQDLGIRPVAEGIEHQEEYDLLRDYGIELFQGYLLAKPQFESFVLIENL